MIPHQRREFERLLMPLRATLAVLSRRLVGPGADAEDVLQAALAAAWSHYRDGREIGNFRAWIVRFLVNESSNHLRRRSLRAGRETTLPEEPEPACSFEDAVSALERELAYEAFAADPSALLECLDANLARAMASLSEGERTALLLLAVAELDYAGIAEACNVPIGTVMSRIFRAREKLRVHLGSARNPRPREEQT